MITAEGCLSRRKRFWQNDAVPGHVDSVCLVDPRHLQYFANCYVSPISFGSEAVAFVVLKRDGSAMLFHDTLAPPSAADAFVDDVEAIDWYDGEHAPAMPRQLVGERQIPDDAPGSPLFSPITLVIAEMRRRKDPDEVNQIRACCRAAESGHAWALANMCAGITELDVFSGVHSACVSSIGEPIVIYGDFAVSPGPERIGGRPTRRILAPGDLFILDYSVVVRGYRCDFTNTICVGGEPNVEQRRLLTMCLQAMKAGEANLAAGSSCRRVYDAVHDAFGDMAVYFTHHAGHGLGLTHPEAPFFVRQANESLIAGDVVTLEPGLYVSGVGGLRIEHNYLITEGGFERLSNHQITL